MMSSRSPQEMATRVGEGLLSFPVTHFADDFRFQARPYRDHIAWLLEHGPAGIFAAGGTGEFFSLTIDEFSAVIRAAVEETAGRVPVIAGCGYGTAMAVEFAKAAEAAGADGLLLMPPYLLSPEQQGLVAHTETVCRATKLGVIFYNRDNGVLEDAALARLCERCPNLVGLKDGTGEIERMMRIVSRLGDRLVYIGGLPTAETFALPYQAMGVTTYSSAIFNFLPEFAQAFYAAVRQNDRDAVLASLREFVLPYVGIRNRRKGYAVSIVKAGMRVVGRAAGLVRPPLVELDQNDMDDLATLIDGRS